MGNNPLPPIPPPIPTPDPEYPPLDSTDFYANYGTEYVQIAERPYYAFPCKTCGLERVGHKFYLKVVPLQASDFSYPEVFIRRPELISPPRVQVWHRCMVCEKGKWGAEMSVFSEYLVDSFNMKKKA